MTIHWTHLEDRTGKRLQNSTNMDIRRAPKARETKDNMEKERADGDHGMMWVQQRLIEKVGEGTKGC